MISHFDILTRLLEDKLVAIVRLESAEQLVEVAKALKTGGFRPCLNLPTIELCKRYGKPVIPGALTPTAKF